MDRFWSKVNKEGPLLRPMKSRCWMWTAYASEKGYGRFYFQGSQRQASRVAWFLAYGEFPPAGLEIDHICNNTGCVNVRHLQLVTTTENTRLRDARKGNPAARTDHCKNGHPFSGDNLYIDKHNHRVCRACARDKFNRYYERKRSAA